MNPIENPVPPLLIFDHLLKSLPFHLPNLPAEIKLQFSLSPACYKEVLALKHADLSKPVSPANVMSYKGIPIIRVAGQSKNILLGPVPPPRRRWWQFWLD